jgi:hypothetical protein
MLPSLDRIIKQVIQRSIHIGEARRMLLRAHPDILVVMEDNVEGLTGAVTHAARVLGIPFIVLPDYIPNPIEPAQYYSGSSSHIVTTYLDRLVALAYPKWIFNYNGRSMLRLASPTVVAYHILGCDPPAPWILNSGYSAAIALDSDTMRTRYVELGFRRDVLRVIGTAQDDRLYRSFAKKPQLRRQILQEIGLEDDRPLIVCAIPPDQYSSSDTSRFEFSTYENLLRTWFGELAAVTSWANVLVRPHPRTRIDALEPLCPPGVHILSAPTEDLVPICDLYVASISTTIRWALSLGIPVINYDCYRYAYGDFSKAKGIVEVLEQAGFAQALHSILQDQAFQRDLEGASRQDRASWGMVDGHYSDRLAALLDEMKQKHIIARPTHDQTAAPPDLHTRSPWARFRASR